MYEEACNFRDDYSSYDEAGVVILGVSPGNPKKHTKFINKYDLPFTLLSDEGHEVAEMYGAWGQKKFMGRIFDGILRTTYLIDKNGVILHVFEKVKPANHSEEVLGIIDTV